MNSQYSFPQPKSNLPSINLNKDEEYAKDMNGAQTHQVDIPDLVQSTDYQKEQLFQNINYDMSNTEQTDNPLKRPTINAHPSIRTISSNFSNQQSNTTAITHSQSPANERSMSPEASFNTSNKFFQNSLNVEGQDFYGVTNTTQIEKSQHQNISTNQSQTPNVLNTQSSQLESLTPMNTQFIINDHAQEVRQQLATDWKQPSEYALHILFTKFVRYAEAMLNHCLKYPYDQEPPIVDILGEGANEDFDKVIDSLGYISRNNLKPVIDAMMFWRKSKSQAALEASAKLDQIIKEYDVMYADGLSSASKLAGTNNSNTHRKLSSNASKAQPSQFNQNTANILRSLHKQIEMQRELAFLVDRKSMISIYILSRVLIEILKQGLPNETNLTLCSKLEEIVFNQLRATDPQAISTSIIRSTNWNSFAELLGWISDKNFISVSDRFVAALEKLPSNLTPDQELRSHLLILGMRYLKLKNYPLEKFEEGADFVHSLAKFFSKCGNTTLICAYAEVLTQLILPLAGSLSAEVNHPVWVEAMELILNTCNKLKPDTKYTASLFKLKVAALCVSPQELFSSKWMELIDNSSLKLKSKSVEERINFAVGVSRLVWVYLFRCTESLNNTEKSLKHLFKLLTSTKKKESWLTIDPILINAIVDILVSVSYNHKSLVIENIIVPLLKSGFSGSIDNLQYEKLLIVINAYKGLLVSKERPEFPALENREYIIKLNDILILPSASNFVDYEEISTTLNKLFLMLDSVMGSEVWSPENEHLRTPSTPFQHIPSIFKNAGNMNGLGNLSSTSNEQASYFNFHNLNNDATGKSARLLNTILFSNLITVIPCCSVVSQHISLKSTIEILSRNAVHEDEEICKSSILALKSLAAKNSPYTLITWFAKYSFDFDEKTQSSYDFSYLNSGEYKKLLMVYIEILECWLESFKKSATDVKEREMGLDGIHLPIKDDPATDNEESIIMEEMEYKNICTVMEEVEGNGLFFLCSYDASIRQLGLHLLSIVSKFDTALSAKSVAFEKDHRRTSSSKFVPETGTRLIDLLKNLEYSSLVPASVLSKFSAAEKQRLTKLSAKQKHGVLTKLADSDYGVDAALWMRAFPRLLSVIFKRSPINMALCRSIVCIRLVQLHDIILSISSNTPSLKFDISEPENLVSQWKLYLIVACSFLTSTSDQVIHIPQIQNHKRKKSQQLFTVQHQKIKSATSIFKMVLPLLGTKNTLIRDAIITGLSAININIYKAFLEGIYKLLSSWKFESSSNTARIELFHILTTCSSFLEDSMIFEDEWIMKTVSHFLQNAKTFLHDDRVQSSLTFQPLRLYFSELLYKYYNSVMNIPQYMEYLFPFEARTSCFNFLMEWCGHGEYSGVCRMRYENMIQRYSGSRDYTSIASSVEFYRTKLEKSSLETMVELCKGPVTYTFTDTTDDGHLIKISFNLHGLLDWINILFLSSEIKIRDLGCAALSNLLDTNLNNKLLYESVLQQCFFYNVSLDVTELYYTTICKSLLRDTDLKLVIDEEDAVTLGLFGVISKKREIRAFAIDLLSRVEMEKHNSTYTKVFKERLFNDSITVYKATGKEISNIFAELPSQIERLKLFSKICLVLDLLSFDLKGDLLVLLYPWVNKFVLKSPDDADTYMILNNAMGITAMCNDRFPVEVEQLWVSLGKGNSFQNYQVVIDFIQQTSYSSRNPRYIEICKDVVLHLSNVPGGSGIVNIFLNDLDIKNTLPNNKVLFQVPEDLHLKYDRLINVDEKIPYNGKDVYFSKVHLSTIFLVNVLNLSDESVEKKVPLLLHICLVFLDHYIPIVQESASRILCDLIYALNPGHEKSEETVSLIKNKAELWAYNQLVKEKKGARSPKAMDLIVKNILLIISGNSKIQEQWQRIACRWATLCAVRHIACRSFQVFRCLVTFLDLKMLKEMLHRLSNTICDDHPDIQGFSMQILMTFNAITAEMSPERLIEFPQLFWALVACLSTTHEQEFIEVLSSMRKFVSKIDLDSPDTVQCLIATFPSDWEGKFDGLQTIIMSGLRSSNSYDSSLQFLNKLNSLKDSKIIANGETRVLFSLLSNMANLLQGLDDKEFLEGIKADCDSLIILCNNYNEPSLSRLINSLKLSKFRSKKDFISQVTSYISRTYFPNYSGQTLVFLLGLLFNNKSYIRAQILEFLKYVFPLIDLHRPEFVGVGADLISSLLSLLLTDFEHEALEVISCIGSINGSKIDKDILRISMGNREIKREYTRTATLFGIPDDESGWSIPMPAITASSTRHNVHSVYSTCHIKVNVRTKAPKKVNTVTIPQTIGTNSLYPQTTETPLMQSNEAGYSPSDNTLSNNGNTLITEGEPGKNGLIIQKNEIETLEELAEEYEKAEEDEENMFLSKSIIKEDEEDEDDLKDEEGDAYDYELQNSRAGGLYNIEEFLEEDEEEEKEEEDEEEEEDVDDEVQEEEGEKGGREELEEEPHDFEDKAGINSFYNVFNNKRNNLGSSGRDLDELEEERRMMILYEYQTSPGAYSADDERLSKYRNQGTEDDLETINNINVKKTNVKSSRSGFLFNYGHQHEVENDTDQLSIQKQGNKKNKAKKEKEWKPKKRSYKINNLLHSNYGNKGANNRNNQIGDKKNIISLSNEGADFDNEEFINNSSNYKNNNMNKIVEYTTPILSSESRFTGSRVSSNEKETSLFRKSPESFKNDYEYGISSSSATGLQRNNSGSVGKSMKNIISSKRSLSPRISGGNKSFSSPSNIDSYHSGTLTSPSRGFSFHSLKNQNNNNIVATSTNGNFNTNGVTSNDKNKGNMNNNSNFGSISHSSSVGSFNGGISIRSKSQSNTTSLSALTSPLKKKTNIYKTDSDSKNSNWGGLSTITTTTPTNNSNSNTKNKTNTSSTTNNQNNKTINSSGAHNTSHNSIEFISGKISKSNSSLNMSNIATASINTNINNMSSNNGTPRNMNSLGMRSSTPLGHDSIHLGNSHSHSGQSYNTDSPMNLQLQDSVSLSHMWTELDNLDNFFAQSNNSTSFWST